MDETTFLALVDKVGAENIMAFGFDNSSRQGFTISQRFSLAQHYDEDLKCLKFETKDVRGTRYITYKPIETIQSIIVAKDDSTWNTLDWVVLRM